jgi:hypothetical protein
VRWLVTEGALVEKVTDEAEREDGRGKSVARCLGVAAKEAGEELGAVFCRGMLVAGTEDGGFQLRGRTSAGDDAGHVRR